MKKLLYFFLICVVIIGGIYLYFKIDFLSTAKAVESLNTQFNTKTTKLATIPAKYPKRSPCEDIDLSPTCFFLDSYAAQSIVFSPTGNDVAYKIVQPNKDSRVIINDKKGHETKGITWYFSGEKDIRFSPDGSKIAYIADGNGNPALVINEKIEAYNASLPEFSSDGKRMAYTVKDGNKMYAVINGKKEGPYEQISGNFIFSEDGKHVMYTVTTNSKSFVVVDGVPQKKYYSIYNPVFLADNTPAYYAATDNSANYKMYIVSGKSERRPEGIIGLLSTNRILPVNGNVGYISTEFIQNGATTDVAHRVIVDGHKWTHILDKEKTNMGYPIPIMSQDKKHLAVVAVDTKEKDHNNLYVLVDDKKVGPNKKYNEVHNVTFSQDGKKFAFVGYQYDSKYIISLITVDLETGEYTDKNIDDLAKTFNYPMKFTPDGTKLIQTVYGFGAKEFVVIGDKKGEEYDQVSKPVISPDGKYVGYGARKGHDLWWVVEKI